MPLPRFADRRWHRPLGILAIAGNLCAAGTAASQGAARALDAFVVAHADDWQLFMGDVLVKSRRGGHPVLVIVTSAGDAARGTEFWQTREAGALASMRAAEALAGELSTAPACTTWRVPLSAPVPGSPARAVRTPFRTVHACHAGSTATVFLRLPDGRPDGSGFAAHGYRSLLRLANTGLGPLVSLDGSARYTDADDLAETVAAIIRGHQRLGLAVRVHTHDPEPLTNVIDHADHRVTGRIALAAAHLLHAPVTLYAGYSNVRRADNLSAEAAAWKAYCFVQYDRAMMARHGTWSAYAENAWAHALYLSRTYARPDDERGLLRHRWP